MKLNFLTAILIGSLGVVVSSCGGGSSVSAGQNYYSASYSSYYNIQNGTGDNESALYLSIVSQGTQYVNNALLTPVSNIESQYEFSQNGAYGIVTIKNGNLGISYTSSSGAWIDFATQSTNIATTIPNGTYNLVCDQTNISPCQMEVNNNSITINEFSVSGQKTTLCNASNLTKYSNMQNPYLWAFSCGVNGGSSAGTWYLMPINIESQFSFLVSEYNPTVNENDDVTDEIAFTQVSTGINPNGSYDYVYSGIVSGGVGTTNAQFTASPATLINSITCGGSLCALNFNQYYYNQSMLGFDWYTNTTSSYNLVGSDVQNIYQDSYEGFYF